MLYEYLPRTHKHTHFVQQRKKKNNTNQGRKITISFLQVSYVYKLGPSYIYALLKYILF